jgi:peptidoglycan hydrolase-like protein with peptidoglycan-binding domain
VLALGFTISAQGAMADSDTGGSAFSATAKPAKAKPAKIRALGDRVPVRKGMRGKDVRQLQGYLGRMGLRVSVDGSFGSQTYTALRTFEKRAKLRVNGIVDSSTDVAKIKKYADQGLPEPPPPAELPAGSKATVNKDGLAAAPADAPQVVKDIIAAGNRIASKPYRYGGGHGRWNDTGYDCSGSVSYALHGGGLLNTQLDSTSFMSWGKTGYGKWISIFANSGHAYMVVAGLRFDTSGANPSRWQSAKRSPQGYTIRHPANF